MGKEGGGAPVNGAAPKPGKGNKTLKMGPGAPELAFPAIFFTPGAKIIEKSFAQ